MDDILMYIPNDITPNYPFCRSKLVINLLFSNIYNLCIKLFCLWYIVIIYSKCLIIPELISESNNYNYKSIERGLVLNKDGLAKGQISFN